MAIESVTPTVPRDLPALLRSTTDSVVPFGSIEAHQYVAWIAALSDLMMLANTGELAEKTTKDVGWLLYELTRTVQAFDECAQRARKAA